MIASRGTAQTAPPPAPPGVLNPRSKQQKVLQPTLSPHQSTKVHVPGNVALKQRVRCEASSWWNVVFRQMGLFSLTGKRGRPPAYFRKLDRRGGEPLSVRSMQSLGDAIGSIIKGKVHPHIQVERLAPALSSPLTYEFLALVRSARILVRHPPKTRPPSKIWPYSFCFQDEWYHREPLRRAARAEGSSD